MKTRDVIYWIAMVLLMLIPIMTDFVRASFSTELFTDPSYWLGVVGVQVPIVILMFTSRTHGKAVEKLKNETYIKYRETITRSYIEINTRGLSQVFDAYVAEDDRMRKLNAYRDKLNRKIERYENKYEKHEDGIKRRTVRLEEREREEGNPIFMLLALWHGWRMREIRQKIIRRQERIEKADARIKYLRVRYIPITTGIIFGELGRSKAKDEDLRIHERGEIATLLATKVLGIVAFGVLVTSSVVFEMRGDWVSIVYNAVVKATQMVISIYFGTTGGQLFIRGEVLDRMRKRVTYLQQFFDKQNIKIQEN